MMASLESINKKSWTVHGNGKGGGEKKEGRRGMKRKSLIGYSSCLNGDENVQLILRTEKWENKVVRARQGVF
jgi:hypothetical protein